MTTKLPTKTGINIKFPLDLYQFVVKQSKKESRSFAGMVKFCVIKYKEFTEKE